MKSWQTVTIGALLLTAAVLVIGLIALRDRWGPDGIVEGPPVGELPDLAQDVPIWIDAVPAGEPDLSFTDRLTLLAKLGDLSDHERRERLGEVLVAEGVARVSTFYSSIWHGGVAGASKKQGPAEVQHSPRIPGPSRGWEAHARRQVADICQQRGIPMRADICDPQVTAARGPIAAAVYGSCDFDLPLELALNCGTRGQDQRLTFRLAEAFALAAGPQVVVYADGHALLLFMDGDQPLPSAPGSRDDWPVLHEARIYLCEAPDWRPRVLYREALRDQWVRGAIVGQTTDEREVFVRIRRSVGNPDPATLLVVDTTAKACQAVASGNILGLWLPSPDGRFLAEGVYERQACYPDSVCQEGLLKLIDRRDGSVTALNKRTIYGGQAYSAVAWSADVPGRLYFTDERDRLWRVDLPTDGTLGDAVDE